MKFLQQMAEDQLTLKADGFLNAKYPGGQEAHKKLLEGENFKIIARGKKYQVADYEKYLMDLM